MKTKIEEKMKALENKFNELKAKQLEVIQQRDNLNTAIAQAQEEMVRMQGEFRGLKSLLDEEDGASSGDKKDEKILELPVASK